MPWYRQGKVAITAGQNTVTGTGTDFSANSRVGDAFQGPDGRWYEVTNITSATVLSILPAYQGATVSGGSYGLAPMQGYVKESADRLRQIVNDWGSTLAGLGTAAFAALTTSSTDTTPGRVTRVGDFGWGGGAQQDSLINNATFGSVVRTYNDPGSPTTSTYVGLHLQREPGGRSADILWGDSPSTMYWRTTNGAGVIGPWHYSYSNRNILGPVSQSGGVPAGAIIQRGSNANGEFVKFADGTMICTWSGTVGYNLTSQYGNNFIAAGSWAFPAQFASPPTMSGAAFLLNRVTYIASAAVSATSWAFTVVDPNGTQASGMYQVQLTAVGRWF
ncbi:hypothetical protein [Pseudomonas alkylphenolica]|uniref:Tail fiber protein n=1 Tax=Pseudomonas alkylphenolica TaxID=237609 RepID=A0A077FC94_9PSED|nr:hypothetical protein [Pseudomonas alkylphenolica]AIL60946.1 tail fiber protein [Pseudomonas alkylphenolica]